ncbi:hypothetical protein [Streptomyces sp. NRRL F-5630]|uniref:hypothetical protein n=1 Tax=Streptomyces sp. NRRL F-5630 TaxID=1463864 RepID=UPI003D70C948
MAAGADSIDDMDRLRHGAGQAATPLSVPVIAATRLRKGPTKLRARGGSVRR